MGRLIFKLLPTFFGDFLVALTLGVITAVYKTNKTFSACQ